MIGKCQLLKDIRTMEKRIAIFDDNDNRRE